MGAVNWKHCVLLALAAAIIGVIASMGAIPQPPEYHQFADQRRILGVPNFWNVVSNVLFLIVGSLGLRALRGAGGRPDPTRGACVVFFAGACLLAAGSAWYHLAPGSFTLVFDRLPLSIALMALFSLVVGTHIDRDAGATLLLPAVIAGLISVVYWYWTEARGAGDLRFYAIMQFTPVILIPAILLLYPKPGSGWLWAMVGAYLVAKLLEHYDAAVYAALGLISGHSLKHAAAALGMYFAYRRFATSEPATSPTQNTNGFRLKAVSDASAGPGQ
jgi:hypothetical protein